MKGTKMNGGYGLAGLVIAVILILVFCRAFGLI